MFYLGLVILLLLSFFIIKNKKQKVESLNLYELFNYAQTVGSN